MKLRQPCDCLEPVTTLKSRADNSIEAVGTVPTGRPVGLSSLQTLTECTREGHDDTEAPGVRYSELE